MAQNHDSTALLIIVHGVQCELAILDEMYLSECFQIFNNDRLFFFELVAIRLDGSRTYGKSVSVINFSASLSEAYIFAYYVFYSPEDPSWISRAQACKNSKCGLEIMISGTELI